MRRGKKETVHGEEGENKCEDAGNPEVKTVVGSIGQLSSAATAAAAGDESDERAQQQPCHPGGEAVHSSVHH